MYKLLLCWRYLRTRYIALVCIVSVMLGVATMIVVNSVMAGFTHEMQARINGMLGDLVFESRSMDGVLDAEAHMQRIRAVAGDAIVGMSPTVHVPALMYIDINDQLLTRQVTMVGIDEATYCQRQSRSEIICSIREIEISSPFRSATRDTMSTTIRFRSQRAETANANGAGGLGLSAPQGDAQRAAENGQASPAVGCLVPGGQPL